MARAILQNTTFFSTTKPNNLGLQNAFDTGNILDRHLFANSEIK